MSGLSKGQLARVQIGHVRRQIMNPRDFGAVNVRLQISLMLANCRMVSRSGTDAAVQGPMPRAIPSSIGCSAVEPQRHPPSAF
jgi:hypothetical protein